MQVTSEIVYEDVEQCPAKMCCASVETFEGKNFCELEGHFSLANEILLDSFSYMGDKNHTP